MQHFGIIAHPVAHSLSPIMYEAGFKKCQIDADFMKFDVAPEDLEIFLRRMREGVINLQGCSVSIPHKQTCLAMLDAVDPVAAQIGAVNTIRNGVGYNTDWIGITGAIKTALVQNRKRMTSMKWKKVLLLGAGGTAAAAAYALQQLGAHTFIWNRTLERARVLAKKFGAEVLTVDPSEGLEPYDFVINTTSVGLAGGESAGSVLPISFWENHGNGIAIDVVYKPRMTQFLRDADRAGWDIFTGEHVLVHQCIAQFELLTGKKVEPKTFFEAILPNLE